MKNSFLLIIDYNVEILKDTYIVSICKRRVTFL